MSASESPDFESRGVEALESEVPDAGDGDRGTPEPDAPGGSLARLGRLLRTRARLLGWMVPIHLVAFIVIYVATDRLLEREVAATAEQLATQRLGEAANEIYIISQTHTGIEGGHLFGSILQANQAIRLRLFLPDGRMMGPPLQLTEDQRRQMAEFLAEPSIHRFWLDSSGGRKKMRGLLKVVSDEQCKPCHQPGATLAAATMEFDVTSQVARGRKNSRRNLFLLIASWALLLGFTTSLVKKSVRRSADRLEAELAAAQAGRRAPIDPGARLVLDPVSARLHESLRAFLQDQREREHEMASRLEHTDQLASLGKLAAGLAHEIKNPLAGIRGALEILREDLPEGGNRELCGEMLSEIDRVNATLQDLLASARPSAPRLAEVDLRGLLEDVQRLLEPGLRRKNTMLRLEVAPGSIQACGSDQDQ